MGESPEKLDSKVNASANSAANTASAAQKSQGYGTDSLPLKITLIAF